MRLDDPHVPGFRLVRSLGAGGMGTVYEAEVESSGERVALKVLTTRSAVGRFREEMRLGQLLQHRGLVPVLASGSAGTTPWFTMPLLRGASLSELRRWVPRPWPEGLVLALARATLDALGFLHQSGVIHRDVKPSNLFLCDDGSLKLIDYGIARAAEGDATLTGTGQLIGSIRYTSPEQAQGRKTDSRTDFFSLGLVLHELLSGERVFPQEDSVAVITALLMGRVARLDELRPEVSTETVDAIESMLAMSPEARPPDVAALRERWPALERKAWPAGDVSAWLRNARQYSDVDTGDSVESARMHGTAGIPASDAGPPAESVRAVPQTASASVRRRGAWIAGLVALVSAGAGAAYWVHLAQRAHPVPPPAPAAVGSVGVAEPAAADVHAKVEAPGDDAPGDAPERAQASESAPGHGSASETPDPKPVSKKHRKPPLGTGFLTLDVRPGWGTVFIDGAKRGVTPLFRLELRAGPHRVDVVRSNGQRERRTVTITRGDVTAVVIPWP